MAEQCEHQRADGTRCRARPMRGRQRCYYHEPSIAGERARANRRGGKAAHRAAATLPADTPDVSLRNPVDVLSVLGMTCNRTLRGQLDVKIANAVAYQCSVALRAFEGAELEARVAALEAVQQQRQAEQGRHGVNGRMGR